MKQLILGITGSAWRKMGGENGHLSFTLTTYEEIVELQISVIQIHSGNQTWQWKMDHLQVMFLLKLPFIEDFPLPCLIITNYIHVTHAYELYIVGITSSTQNWDKHFANSMNVVIFRNSIIHFFAKFFWPLSRWLF